MVPRSGVPDFLLRIGETYQIFELIAYFYLCSKHNQTIIHFNKCEALHKNVSIT